MPVLNIIMWCDGELSFMFLWQAMHSFRDNTATFLLATPAAARGLDMPAVSHIYNLDCPDVTSYVHRAGRAGRIGSPVKGGSLTPRRCLNVTCECKPSIVGQIVQVYVCMTLVVKYKKYISMAGC